MDEKEKQTLAAATTVHQMDAARLFRSAASYADNGDFDKAHQAADDGKNKVDGAIAIQQNIANEQGK